MLRAATTLLLLAVLATATMTACSTDQYDDPPPDEVETGLASTEPTVGDREAVVQGLAELYAGDHAQPSDRRTGQCFAEALLERTDVEALRAGGVLDDSGAVVRQLPVLEPALAEAWVEAQFECVDYVEESTRAQAAQSRGGIDRAAYAGCLRDAITTAQVKAAVRATLTGAWDAPAVRRLSAAQAGCAERAS